MGGRVTALKLGEIYNGWKNLAVKSPEVEEIAKKRAIICACCSKLKNNNQCDVCGCYVPAKVRSLKSSCPIKKWDMVIVG